MKRGGGCRRCVNVKISYHRTLVRVFERAKYGVKEEVGDRTEGGGVGSWVCVECRWVKIWVMGMWMGVGS